MIVLQWFSLIPLSARYMMMSAFGFAFMGVFVKIAGAGGIPVLEIVAARAFVSLILSYMEIKRKRVAVFGQRKGLLFARGIVGVTALSCVYYSLVNLPFAEATVLQYLHPMFTAVIAFLFLQEKLSLPTLLCIVFSFIGLLFITQPSLLLASGEAFPYSSLAVTAAIAGALGSAVSYALVRKLNATEDSSVIIFYFPMMALPLSLIALGDDFVMPSGWMMFVLLMVGLGTQVGQIGLTKSMQTEKAGKAMSFSYLQVVFALLFGVVLFDEIPTFWTLLGAGFIVGGALMNVIYTMVRRGS